MRRTPRSRVLCPIVVFVAAVALALAGCGEGSPADQREPSVAEHVDAMRATIAEQRPLRGLREREGGEGARRAFVFWSEELAEPPADVVVLLHGWAPEMLAPELYGEWIVHLAERGSAVVFPLYLPPYEPAEAPERVLAAAAAGLEALGAEPASLIVGGHTTGGALAFDYAAGAADAGLPRPDAIFALYPGRNPSEWIPPIDPTKIAPRTRIAVLSGAGNPVVGGGEQARELLRSAKRIPPQRRRYVDVDPAAEPIGSDPATRRAIWRPVDRLIEAARREARG